MIPVPNLFQFATKEFSQDAFIAWLLAWFDHPEDPALQSCAKHFVAHLCRMQSEQAPDPDDILHLLPPFGRPDESAPHRQYRHIDVYFRIACRGNRTLGFIVENKTHTGPHGDQLKLYRNRIATEAPQDGAPICIYYKTGYIFDNEREEAVKHRYSVLGAEDMLTLLTNLGHQVSNHIFRDYVAHLGQIVEDRKKVLRQFFSSGTPELLRHDYCQYEAIKRIDAACGCARQSIGVDESTRAHWNTDHRINPGTNHGEPWTTLLFACFPAIYGDAGESLFYRLQLRGSGPSQTPELILQQYSSVKGNPSMKLMKRKRRDEYRAVFQELLAAHAPALLPRSLSNRGDCGTELTAFPITPSQSFDSLLCHLPALHHAFISRLRQSASHHNELLIPSAT